MLQFQNTISIADITNFVLLSVAIIGIFFTYYQIKQGYKTQKATFFQRTIFNDVR